MPNTDKLAEFTAWCQKNITGDEKGQAQIFLDRLFRAFGQSGCLDAGGTTEFRVRRVAATIERGGPVTAPGVPKKYPDANKLVTEDCIKPRAGT